MEKENRGLEEKLFFTPPDCDYATIQLAVDEERKFLK